VKKDYNASADTIDLIPIAAWHGSGRKAKWWSPILLAVRNPTGSLEAVTKCISGFTDKFYIANKEQNNEDTGEFDFETKLCRISRPPRHLVQAASGMEMAFADITKVLCIWLR
jgi:DNA ligase-1